MIKGDPFEKTGRTAYPHKEYFHCTLLGYGYRQTAKIFKNFYQDILNA